MACIDEIVTIGLCDTEPSTSGYTLMKAPGISPKVTGQIAQEQYGNALELLQTIKDNAIRMVRTDFNSFLQVKQVASELTKRKYDSASFNIAKSLDLYAGFRGQTLFANSQYQRGKMRQFRVYSVETYALASGDGDIVIADFDNGIAVQTAYPTTFIAGQKQIHELPEPYVATSGQVSVLIDNTTINFASTKILCGAGCGGQARNPCAKVEGYDGDIFVRSEGYGMNVIFSCDCDYDKLICDLAPSFTGELIWYKMQELFYEEMLKSDRLTPVVTYNRAASEAYRQEAAGKYQRKYDSMISAGMIDMLAKYNDDCLDCRGIRTVTNV